MDCGEIQEKLYLYLDGELDEPSRLVVEEHVSGCAACSSMLAAEKNLDALIRNGFARLEAPGALKENIAGSLEARPFPGPAGIFRGAVFAVVLAAASLAFVLLRGAPRRPGALPILREAVASHAGFFAGNLGPDISSGSFAEISRWLKASTGFDGFIPDLSPEGYDLAGARSCRLMSKPAGCLIYVKGAGRISVFLFDPSGIELGKEKKTHYGSGFFYSASSGKHRAVLYSDGDSASACLFVSDISEAELLRMIKSSFSRR